MLTMPICAGAPSLWVPGAIWVASARVRPPQPPKKWALLWLNPLKLQGVVTTLTWDTLPQTLQRCGDNLSEKLASDFTHDHEVAWRAFYAVWSSYNNTVDMMQVAIQ